MSKLNVRVLREVSGLSQSEFWKRIGVTQSGGSRYETNERRIPRPVQQLLRLMYVERINLDAVTREMVELIEYLQAEEKPLFEQLKKKSAEWHRTRPTLRM